MPTFTTTRRFERDYAALSAENRARFKTAVREFVADLAGGKFRKSLRVRGVQGARNVFEMTWAPDGRATFSYGPEQVEGEPHVVWRRVGTHDVLHRP